MKNIGGSLFGCDVGGVTLVLFIFFDIINLILNNYKKNHQKFIFRNTKLIKFFVTSKIKFSTNFET